MCIRVQSRDTSRIHRRMDINEDGKIDFNDVVVVVESCLEGTLNPPELCWR